MPHPVADQRGEHRLAFKQGPPGQILAIQCQQVERHIVDLARIVF